MTVVSNNFEGGTDGVLITGGPGNSGGASGTAFDAIFGTGFTFSATDATQGSMGATTGTGAFGAGQWTLSSVTKVAAKIKFKAKATPTADTYLIRVHNGGTRLFSVHINAAAKIRVDDAAGTTGVFTFANAITSGTVYRLEVYVVAGSTTSNGTIKVGYYLGNSTTPVETVYLNTAANVGAATNFTTLIMGKYNNATEAYGFDEFAYDVAATDFIGVGTTTPPTVSTPANQNVSASASVSASVTASSSTGTISSYAWSYVYPASGGPTLSGAGTNTVSFTAGSAGALYQLQCVVTDSNALTTTVTTEVRVPTTGVAVFLPGAAAAGVGTWANVGGASTPGDAVSDNSDTTYVESANLSASAVTERFRFQPMTARSSLDLPQRFQQDTSGTTTIKFRLFEGTTQRQEWTQAITTSWATYTFSASGGTIAAITDWGNLYGEAVATAP